LNSEELHSFTGNQSIVSIFKDLSIPFLFTFVECNEILEISNKISQLEKILPASRPFVSLDQMDIPFEVTFSIKLLPSWNYPGLLPPLNVKVVTQPFESAERQWLQLSQKLNPSSSFLFDHLKELSQTNPQLANYFLLKLLLHISEIENNFENCIANFVKLTECETTFSGKAE
jgi:hypothetical protein